MAKRMPRPKPRERGRMGLSVRLTSIMEEKRGRGEMRKDLKDRTDTCPDKNLFEFNICERFHTQR